MAIANWNDSLSTGIREVDEQHKKLLAMINDLGIAMKERKTAAELGRVISGLKDYTVRHFTLEEVYFRQHGYPDAAAHVAEHRDFVEKVEGYNRDLKEGKLFLGLEVMNFLSDWLIKHIKGSDQRYAPYLKGKGVS